jgi:hypothetical protein
MVFLLSVHMVRPVVSRALSVIGLLFLVLSGIGRSFAASPDSWLITPDEAVLAPAVDDGIRSRALSDAGPGIEIVKPAEGEIVPSPAEILIRFLPKSVAVDLSSLKVTLLKFIPIDLTDRLKPYVSPNGIVVKEANVPTGAYRVRITLSDAQGKTSMREISFEIR